MGQNSFGLTGAVAARNHHRSRACDRPLRGRGALVAKFQRRAVLSLSCAKVAACRANQAVSKAAVCQHAADGQRFRHGRACAIQPIKRNPHISNAKRRCDRLCKKIPGKCHSDIRRLKTGFSDRQYSSFFLESAFGVFPGICPEAWIFAHHIKTVSERPFAFFFADDRSRTLNIDRLLKSETCFSGLNCWFHPTTSISLRI